MGNGTRQWLYQGKNANADDTNDANEFYFQFGPNSDHLETCKVLLLAKMMSSESFEVLRTQEALGYVATTFARTSVGTNNINYIVVLVVSGHYNASYIQSRILHFVNYFYEEFMNEISDEMFASFVEATVSDIKESELTLSDFNSFLWNEIIGHTYVWDKVELFEEILHGEDITLDEMKRFYAEKVLGQGRKWLSVQLYSEKNKTFSSNITQYEYNLNGHDFDNQFVIFDAPKSIQNVHNLSFYAVY